MNLTLVTPQNRVVTSLEVDEIIVPGSCGQLDILPGHAPLVTTLKEGAVRYKEKGKSTFNVVVVSWGYLEVNPKQVMILAETAEPVEEIEKDRAEAAKKLAETKLKEGLTVGDMIKYQRKLKRAQIRLDVINNKN